MCTLIVLHRCVPGTDLVVAANRDEYLSRPSEGLALRPGPAGPIVAPRDGRAGGTWLGVNARGLFAALTNRPSAPPDPVRPSRGHLVTRALAFPDATSAAAELAQLAPETYNPFNLLVADGRSAFAIVYERHPRLIVLEPGAHVVGNGDPNARDIPKVDRVLAGAQAASRLPAERVLDALGDLCRGHEGDGGPLASACVHAGGFGTRSSTLLRLGPTGPRLLHAEGPPCTTPYRDFTSLLIELGRTTVLGPGGPAVRKAS